MPPDPSPEDTQTFALGGLSRTTYSDLLSNRAYRRYFLATLASSLGDWIGLFAILALTESIVGRGQASRATAFAFSGVMIARILPTMIVGPVAGVYADRWDRKRTLIATDVGRGLVMAVIPFSQDFLMLFVLSFLVEVLSMLFAPAKEATLPNLVPHERLVQANQLNLIATYGPFPLGGILLAAFVALAGAFDGWPFLSDRPASVAIWANSVTFFVSGWLFSRIAIPRHDPERTNRLQEDESAFDQLKEGFRFIVTRPRVRALIAGVMAAAFAGGALFTLAKLFVSAVGAGDAAYGLLVSAVGTGMFVGLVGSLKASERFGNDRVFAPGIGAGGLAAFAVAFMPGVSTALPFALVMGAGAGLAFVTGYTLLQSSTDDEVRGRAFAAFNTGVRLAIFAALVIAPALVGVIGTESSAGYAVGGVRITMAVSGLVALGGAVWSGRQLHQAQSESRRIHPSRGRGRRTGLFIVFEGGEGAGKSTQLRLLRAVIERSGRDVVVTREPGGTELGERLRDLLLAPDGQVEPRAEALLYAAARAQHADEVIRPALREGQVVLCDRYIDSSVVYQGVARGLGEEDVERLSRWGTQRLVPDLVILLDIDARDGLARAGSIPDRLESEGLDFHEAVNAAFRQRAAARSDRYLVVDANQPVETVHARIRERVLRLLGDQEDQLEAVAAATPTTGDPRDS